MKQKNNKILELLLRDSLRIRFFEQTLLDHFSKGIIGGTTHTCIGQENNAVGISLALNRDDIVLSNHRCHGHFLAHTKNYKGLINEILGNEDGVCSGIGGSQHLFYKKIFYSNGILGGNAPMCVGLAKSIKFKNNKKIVTLFLGDGSLGEGIIYEALNFISIYNLPVLIVIEDNGIAQTTETKKTISGKIYKRCIGFGIKTTQMNYPDAFEIYNKSKKIINMVRNGNPHILILKSTRLGPHSKGDDTRSVNLIRKLSKIDPLLKLRKKIRNKKLVLKVENRAKKFIENIFYRELKPKSLKKLKKKSKKESIEVKKINYLSNFEGKRFGELINHFFLNLAKKNKEIIFFGEDISDPYGGAFKITRNLKKKFPHQVFSTPISEATLVGIGSGLAIEGYKPIIEIMFGDFLGLAFDQILNNLSKFHYMYNNEVFLPLIIRTPMGGRRGYGPTHSQSIEKHFYGIKGFNIYSVNPYFPIDLLYYDAWKNTGPNLIIENKIMYNFLLEDLKISYLKNFKEEKNLDTLITSLSLTDFKNDECTIICHGGLFEFVLDAVYKFYIETEISCKVIILSKISPLSIIDLKSSLCSSGPILVVEESNKSFGLGSEIGSILNEDSKLKLRKFLRISSEDEIIPSSINLEKKILIDSDKIYKNLENLFK